MERDIIPGLTLGMGADALLGKIRGEAIEHDGPRKPERQGQRVWYQLEVASSLRELSEALDVSASGSYSGVFSASARASYVTSGEFSRYHTYVVVKCRVTNPITVLQNVRPKPNVDAWVKTATRDRFEKRFGNEFLVGEVSGGAYYGIIDIASTTAEQQREIGVAISGSGWGATADVKVSERLRNASSDLRKTIEVFREGGSGDNPTGIDEMIAAVVSFPSAVEEHSVAYRGIFKEYGTVMFSDFATDPSPEDVTRRHNDIETLGRIYIELLELRGNVAYLMHNLARIEVGEGTQLVGYDDSNDATVAQRRQLLRNNLTRAWAAITEQADSIPEIARRCRNGEAYTLPTPYVPDFPLPEIKGENMEIKAIRDQLAALNNEVVARGTIVMWSGATVPDRWALCDGQTARGYQTPDLRGRFVVGFDPNGKEYARVGDLSQGGRTSALSGGQANVTHTHEVPGHSHGKGDLRIDGSGEHTHRLAGDGSGGDKDQHRPKHVNHTHVHRSYVTNNDGSHGHPNTAFAGRVGMRPATGKSDVDGDAAIPLPEVVSDNRPPFYVLAYIMKVA